MLKSTHPLYVKFAARSCLDMPRDPSLKRRREGACASYLLPIHRRAALFACLMVAAMTVGQARAQIGACCLGNGNCVDTNASGCATLGGEFMGAGTSCATSTCSGACCLGDLSCVQVSRDECTNGAFRGAGSSCETHCPGPSGTAFTYQGRLDHAGAPVNANADFEFRLFVSAVGDPQISPTVTAQNVQINDGLFVVPIDFGPLNLNIDVALWLEIALRSPAGSGSFTTLTPRQKLTGAPFALRLPGVNVDVDGRVGIGTTSLESKMEIAAQDALTIRGPEPFITFADTHSGNARVQLQNSLGRFFITSESYLNGSNPGGFTMVDSQGWLGVGTFNPVGPLDVRSSAGSLTLSGFGNVGIGTDSPSTKLEVRGDIGLGSTGQLRATAGEENLRMLRGFVNTFGEIREGSGFTVESTGSGTYRITFNTPFRSPPTVTASAIPSSIHVLVANASQANENFVDVTIRRPDTQALQSFPFNFIAVGPR